MPLVGIGALVIHQEQVLMVLRAAPPGTGQWSIPGGLIKLGESLQQAAEREIQEETSISIQAGDPVYVFDWIEQDEVGGLLYHYIIVDLWAKYLSGSPKPGDDAQDASWIALEELDRFRVNANTRLLLQRVSKAGAYYDPNLF